jgi:hypothetical protein
MDPKRTRSRVGPEAPIKAAIKKFMEDEQWLVIVTHGNAFQAGLPDLYCAHRNHGVRWVEVKYAGKYEFTDDQLRVFPALASKGVNIHVLAMYDPRSEVELREEYKKLWLPPNYYRYIWHSSGKY